MWRLFSILAHFCFSRNALDAKYPMVNRQMRQIADRQQQQIDRLEGELKKLATVYFMIITLFVLYTQVLINRNFQLKIVNIFLPINFNICFGCSKERSL